MKTALRFLLSSLLLLFPITSSSKIYHCKNSNGQSTYSDQACDQDQKLIKTIEQNINSAPNNLPSDEQGKTLKTIYTGNINASGSRFLRVAIHEETDTHIIFYVEGFYNGSPRAKVQFRVIPNLSWNANFFESSKYGISKGYSRVALGLKANDTEESDILRLEIWQEIPGKPIKILEKKIIPYKKTWSKDSK